MNVIDLFAGAGGLSEGFRRAGYDVRAHVEMDKDASLTLKTRESYYYCLHNNNMDVYKKYIKKEITREDFYAAIPESELAKVINYEISKESIPIIFENIDRIIDGKPVDGIIGGPPCQAYSLAGRARNKYKTEDDPRNYLYLYYLEFLKKYKPKFFVFENVQGILTAKNGKIFEDIKKEMQKLDYTIDYKLLDSSDFGVVQNRKRIIIIGFKKELNLIYPDFEYIKSKPVLIDLFEDLPSIKPGQESEKYAAKPNKYLIDAKIRENNWDVLNYNSARRLNENDKQIYDICIKNIEKNGKNIKYDDLPEKLKTHKNTNSFLDRFKVLNKNSQSHTIVAHISKDGHYYIHPDLKQCRSITVREAARIQSFPDNYYFESSQTSAYKQIGNAVPPLMAEKIAEKIRELFD